MTIIDYDDELWFDVEKEGISVHSNYDDNVPIPFEKMDKLFEMMNKIRGDVENGKFVFEPSYFGVFTDNMGMMRNCPVCGSEKVCAKSDHTLTYDVDNYGDVPKDVTASYLYKRGIPYRYTDWYECKCSNCGYRVWGKGPSDRTSHERYCSMLAVVEEWNECEPSEETKKNCEFHLQLKRECEERERQMAEIKKHEMERFYERKDDVKHMLGWE